MNLPNKITLSRIVITVIIVLILIIPFNALGIDIPKLFVAEKVVVDLRYIIAGVLFIIASITDFVDGYIARKQNIITNFGKMSDAIADKFLVNSVLIILAASGFISAIIPVIVVSRDTFVNSLKMAAGSKKGAVPASLLGKVKTICMLVGISLTLFYNLPFELYNIRVSDFLLLIAVVLSVISAVQYYVDMKNFIDIEK